MMYKKGMYDKNIRQQWCQNLFMIKLQLQFHDL